MDTIAPPVPLVRARAASVRQAYYLALTGALGAVCGLYLDTELVLAESVWVRDAWAGVWIGGTIGFFLNAAGPLSEGAWLKLARKATWGALAGAAGGAAGLVLGEIVIGQFQGGLIGRARIKRDGGNSCLVPFRPCLLPPTRPDFLQLRVPAHG